MPERNFERKPNAVILRASAILDDIVRGKLTGKLPQPQEMMERYNIKSVDTLYSTLNRLSVLRYDYRRRSFIVNPEMVQAIRNANKDIEPDLDMTIYVEANLISDRSHSLGYSDRLAIECDPCDPLEVDDRAISVGVERIRELRSLQIPSSTKPWIS